MKMIRTTPHQSPWSSSGPWPVKYFGSLKGGFRLLVGIYPHGPRKPTGRNRPRPIRSGSGETARVKPIRPLRHGQRVSYTTPPARCQHPLRPARAGRLVAVAAHESRLAIPSHCIDLVSCFFPRCRPQVAHRRCEVLVACVGLHGPQIDPTAQQLGDEGPPESVKLELLTLATILATITVPTVKFAPSRQTLDGQQQLCVRLAVTRGEDQAPAPSVSSSTSSGRREDRRVWGCPAAPMSSPSSCNVAFPAP